MSGYKRYDRYKDSGIEWIGKIPEHWEVSKLKYVIKALQTGSTPTTQNEEYFEGQIDWFTPVDFHDSLFLEDSIRKISDQAINDGEAKILPKETIMIIGIGATLGKVGIILNESSCNQQITGIICDTGIVFPGFLMYWLHSIYSYIRNIANSTTLPILNNQNAKEIPCLLPSINEQEKIIEYLELQFTEIDGLITDKERMIELLQEHRQAIISEAVTKGLNPDVKMKDSGIEWIGEIPEGWEIEKIKYLASVNPNKSEIRHLPAEQEVTFIPMEKIIGIGVVDYSITNTIENVINGYTYFKDGDIILAKVTPCFENGNIAVLDGLLNGIGFGTTELHVLRCKSNCYNSFLFYYFQSSIFKSKGVSEMYGVAGLKRIPTNFILNYKLAVPNYREQEKIANFLDQKIAEIDELVSDIQLQIQKLKEYRQSLISEAVTGKIDVRDYKDN